jgi:predicted N-acetyltransferase YhbS
VGRVLELEDLFGHPDWMNRGIGRRLVRDSVSIARQHHIQCLAVTANPHALGRYENVGFVYAGEVETCYGPGVRMHLDVAAEVGSS